MLMCFFVFLKFPMTFDYSANVSKRILKEIPARPQLCKNALNKDILSAQPHWQWKTALFFGVLCRRGGFTSSLVYYRN